MKDLLGNKVKKGDVLLELGRGCNNFGEKMSYHMKLWEMPKNFDGHGFLYNMNGEKHKFAWAHPHNSILVDFDKLDPNFKYSFYHGMDELQCDLEEGNLIELIENSDWKKRAISEEDVEGFLAMENLKIETKEDVFNNIALLKNNSMPRSKMYDVLSAFGYSASMALNGEIGISYLQDLGVFHQILSHIENELIQQN